MVFQETPLQALLPTVGRDLILWSLSLRSKEFVSHMRHSNPWELYQRDEPPKFLELKTYEAYFQENHRAQGMENVFLTGSHKDPLTLEPNTKTV